MCFASTLGLKKKTVAKQQNRPIDLFYGYGDICYGLIRLQLYYKTL